MVNPEPGRTTVLRLNAAGYRARIRPMELTPIQSTGTQPDAQAIVDQDLHPVAPLVGEQIGAMRPGRTKDLNNPRQSFIGPGPHIQRLGSQPDLIDTDHPSRSRSNAAH